MRRLVKTFKALSDTNRIRILKMLEVRPLCVCEISTVLGIAELHCFQTFITIT